MSNPQESVYIEYLNYDWDSFTEFKDGLKEILDNYLENLKEQDPLVTSIPALDKQQLVEQAKCFFYCSHTGNILELDDYHQWKLHNEAKFSKNKKITEIKDEEDLDLIAKESNDLNTNQESDVSNPPNQESNGLNTSEDSNPPYSSNYKELVELILAGKEVPGIRQIPDTVLPEKVSESTKTQRAKPWERANDNV